MSERTNSVREMTPEDGIYVFLLVLSIAIGPFFREIKGAHRKKWTATVIGFILVLILCRAQIVYPAVCLLVNCIIITKIGRCHAVSFAFTFGFLGLCRIADQFGGAKLSPPTNMILMVLSLKIVGLAFEARDAKTLQTDKKDKSSVTAMDVIHYCLCYIGVLAGPYFTYKTYRYYFSQEHVSGKILYWEASKTKLLKLPVIAAIFFSLSYAFPQKYIFEEEFYQQSAWYRWAYCSPLAFITKMRLGFAFVLTELTCTSSGFGAFPAETEPVPVLGPTKNLQLLEQKNHELECNFEAVSSVKLLLSEFSPSIKQSNKYWNTSVQYWLIHHVYGRLPKRPLTTKILAVLATNTVSAYWHGIHIGLFFAYAHVAVTFVTDQIIMDVIYYERTEGTARKISSICLWLHWTACYAYFSIGSILKDWDTLIKFYSSIYFGGTFLNLAVLVVGTVILAKRVAVKKKKVEEKVE